MELFSGYLACIEKDEDENTVFMIDDFMQRRPSEYAKFYLAFF